MYLIETRQMGDKKWKTEPVKFADMEEAERYAEKLYKKLLMARVVDERYRK